jgi:hypothetical protein
MKKLKLALGLMILPFIGLSQSTAATNNQNVLQTRYLGFDNNFPLRTVTAGITRTILMGTAPAGSISGALGLGAGLNTPLAKLHVQDFATTVTDAQGRMFRTDGSSTFENRWMLFTGTNAATNLERFRIATYTNADANSAYLGTVQNGWLNFRTNNINRIKLNETYTNNATQYDIDQYATFGNTNTTVNTSGYWSCYLCQDTKLRVI